MNIAIAGESSLLPYSYSANLKLETASFLIILPRSKGKSFARNKIPSSRRQFRNIRRFMWLDVHSSFIFCFLAVLA